MGSLSTTVYLAGCTGGGMASAEGPHVVRSFLWCLSRVKDGAERRQEHPKLPSWERRHSKTDNTLSSQ